MTAFIDPSYSPTNYNSFSEYYLLNGLAVRFLQFDPTHRKVSTLENKGVYQLIGALLPASPPYAF